MAITNMKKKPNLFFAEEQNYHIWFVSFFILILVIITYLLKY